MKVTNHIKKNNTFIIKRKDEETNDEYEEKIDRKGVNITSREIEGIISKYGKLIEEYKTKNKAFLLDAFENTTQDCRLV